MTTQEDKVRQFSEALAAEIESIDKFLLPLLREYLNNVRDIRMALAREVQDILRSTGELSKTTKTTPELHDFLHHVIMLEQTLTPEFITKLRLITCDLKINLVEK